MKEQSSSVQGDPCPLCAVQESCKCIAGAAPRRLARQLSSFMASILPAAVLLFLPKCPLCLAAWLALATGVSIPATGAAWLRASIVMLCIAALASILWRRASGDASAFLHRLHSNATVGAIDLSRAGVQERSSSLRGFRQPEVAHDAECE